MTGVTMESAKAETSSDHELTMTVNDSVPCASEGSSSMPPSKDHLKMDGHLIQPKVSIDSSAIRSIPLEEQDEDLRSLGLNVYDQMAFEEGVLQQVDQAYQQQEAERQRQQAQRSLDSVLNDIRTVKLRLGQIEKALAMMASSAVASKEVKRKIDAIQKEKENKHKQLKTLRAKQKSLSAQLGINMPHTDTDVESDDEVLDSETKFQLEEVMGLHKARETERERMIRAGKMTPFGTVMDSNGQFREGQPKRRKIVVSDELTDFEKYLMDQEQRHKEKAKVPAPKTAPKIKKPEEKAKSSTSGDFSRRASESDDEALVSLPSTSKEFPPLVPKPKRKHRRKINVGTLIEGKDDKKIMRNRKKFHGWPDADANCIDLDSFTNEAASGSEYEPSDNEDGNSDIEEDIRKKVSSSGNKAVKRRKQSGNGSDADFDEEPSPSKAKRNKRLVDDGDQNAYIKRLREWKRKRLEKLHERLNREDANESCPSDEDEDAFEEFEGGYRIPLSIWSKVYRYQQTCVRWLWELHCQKCGGIVGDEMGLGKTIQIIAYLAGLSQSSVVSKDGKFKGLGPVIIVSPTTVMHQWVKEFHTWWPPFRVAVLHESGSHQGTKESLIRNVNKVNGILVTSYSGITAHQDELLKYDWHYIILDEGHKIRNPDARATLSCKQFRTPHRIILSGSPMQNNLKELWSLFDFVFPGKLGTLPIFMQQFSVPITQGGYANATQVQVQTAYKCAVVLRDTISPYLLRRMKADVKMNLNLPGKNEQVLFCRLSDEQRELYQEYLDSKEVQSILDGRLQVFVGLTNLRKICNHPDLYSGGPKIFGNVEPATLSEDMHYGFWKRSGKMTVIHAILKLWHRQGHRVLLFSQSKQMLDILERFVKIQDYSYLRMDGGTNIGSRQPLVNKFNSDPSIFVFLLTTRVGGLGVNLTGANRVVIYDPDWNPSTDMQARERAWRIGQQRDVTVYRLLTTGTIEEKIYHRQIFKQFLTNRVLKDPKQRRFFKSNDLLELFVLREEGVQGTETSAIFAGTGSEVTVTPQKSKPKGEKTPSGSQAKSCLSEDKILKMRELAKKLSQRIGKNAQKSSTTNDSKPSVSADVQTSVKTDHKQKRKRRGSKFDGVRIHNLVRNDTFQSTGQQDEGSVNTPKQDEYVLQKLFAKTGVHSAIKHDLIMDASNPDYVLVEGEAERVAKEAVKALRNSRKHCFRAESGIPTWTGSNGLSGAPVEAKRALRFGQKRNTRILPEVDAEDSSDGLVLKIKSRSKNSTTVEVKKAFSGEPDTVDDGEGLSSGFLLSRMKQRNHLNRNVGGHSSEDDEDVDALMTNGESLSSSQDQRLTTEYDELLVDLRNFIAFQCTVDGEATTEEVLREFKSKIPIKDNAVFKALLTKICNFTKNFNGVGVWQLRAEFR